MLPFHCGGVAVVAYGGVLAAAIESMMDWDRKIWPAGSFVLIRLFVRIGSMVAASSGADHHRTLDQLHSRPSAFAFRAVSFLLGFCRSSICSISAGIRSTFILFSHNNDRPSLFLSSFPDQIKMSAAGNNNNGNGPGNGGRGRGGGGRGGGGMVRQVSDVSLSSRSSSNAGDPEMQQAMDALFAQVNEAVGDRFDLWAYVQNQVGDLRGLFFGQFARVEGRVDRVEAEMAELRGRTDGNTVAVALGYLAFGVSVGFTILRWMGYNV